jgi:energy-coupling factor transporter ATP-binding protein EcfA2
MKIKDLLHLEELDRVIDIDSFIDSEDKARDTIEKYIVTDAMKGHMKKIANDLDRAKHHSYQVIGNYGSGKSHLLAVIAAIIDNPSLIDYIQDEEVKNSFKSNLNRDYAVIQFELQPSQHTLSDFFYDRLEDKLKKKYDIEIPEIDTEEIYDHKEKIKEILDIIKSHDPKMGLVVIIDEISDFLKTKPTKEMKYQDTQFMRVLAQASNQMDFIFMGSMQENVFSSNEFVEEAESFGRTAQRYEIISISKEDIKKVLSRRALKKDISQIEQLKELLSEYGKQIPQVQSKLNEFVNKVS